MANDPNETTLPPPIVIPTIDDTVSAELVDGWADYDYGFDVEMQYKLQLPSQVVNAYACIAEVMGLWYTDIVEGSRHFKPWQFIVDCVEAPHQPVQEVDDSEPVT